MMMDWNAYQKELASAITEIARASPTTIRGYRALGEAGADALLDSKTRELIALAVAVTLRCDGCIVTHVSAAMKAGATREEAMEALSVAIAVNAGAALVYSARVVDSWAAKAS